jgi:hypothetical protein
MNNENDEARMANVEGMTKPEFRGDAGQFVILHLPVHSSFVIRPSLFS